jgi:excisionase family DNA binding protein
MIMNSKKGPCQKGQHQDIELRKRSEDAEIFNNRIMEQESWLTSAETAKMLKVSVSELLNMCSAGTITYYKLGRRNRYHVDDLEKLLRSQKRGGRNG